MQHKMTTDEITGLVIQGHIAAMEHSRSEMPECPHWSQEKFLQTYASYNTPQELPSDFQRGRAKECFANAGTLAINDRNLIYCEGLAYCGFLPVLHAWCIDLGGNVIDNTWTTIGTEYFGVAFNTEFLVRTILKSKHWGLIDNWSEKWPLLTTELREQPELWRHNLTEY